MTQIANPNSPTYQKIIALAVPVFVANLAMPLQGVIDVAVVGHMPNTAYLAGLGIATQLWLLILVSFNFLQYASSGLSAQASGTPQANHELPAILLRSLTLSFGLMLVLWLMKPWILDYGLQALGAMGLNREVAETYLNIRYFGIGFELANFVFIGWLAGQGKTRLLMRVQLGIAFTNIVATLALVFGFGLGIKGVALGTVLGYVSGSMLATLLAWRLITNQSAKTKQTASISQQGNWLEFIKENIFSKNMLRLFSLNKDIFVRTLLLTLSFAWITRLSALQGDTVMATNALLLQVLTISAFALDGVAVATESLVGKSVGDLNDVSLQASRDNDIFKTVLLRTFMVIFGLAVCLSGIWWLALPLFLQVMTELDMVKNLALDYRLIVALLPVIGAGAYWIDGVMFGLTAGKQIRNGALTVAVLFFPLTWWLYQTYGTTHAMPVIWFAVYFLLLARFVVLGVLLLRKMSPVA